MYSKSHCADHFCVMDMTVTNSKSLKQDVTSAFQTSSRMSTLENFDNASKSIHCFNTLPLMNSFESFLTVFNSRPDWNRTSKSEKRSQTRKHSTSKKRSMSPFYVFHCDSSGFRF